MIAFVCEQCGERYEVSDTLEGRRVRCKKCAGVTRVPPPAPPPPTPIEVNVFQAAQPGSSERLRKRTKTGTGGAWAFDWKAGISLAIGAGLAALARGYPVLGMVPSTLIIVVHELGHAGTSWILGIAALPAFDLRHGGGITVGLARQPLLNVAVLAAFAIVIVRHRRNRLRLAGLVSALGVYALLAFTSLRDPTIVAMGHGLTTIIAGVFLYRALSGRQILHGAERPLYAFLGFYFIAADLSFTSGLIRDALEREIYATPRDDGMVGDLSRLGDDYTHLGLQNVARLLFVACLMVAPAAFGAAWLTRRARD